MFTKSFFFLHISSHLSICLHHFVIQVCGFFVLASFALFLHSAQFVQSLKSFFAIFFSCCCMFAPLCDPG
jgi:hypothetical protein